MKVLLFPKPAIIATLFFVAILFQYGCKKDPVVPPDSTVPTVITSAVSAITSISAVTGGIVSQKGSSEITAKGVCWSTSQNPVVTGDHTNDGTGTAVYTSNMTGLTPNTTYYVRAYATNSAGTGYGSSLSFITLQAPTSCDVPISYEGKNYETVLINSQCWFKENLNVGTRINGTQNQANNGILEKHCYNDEETNCDFYGALYQWGEMLQYDSIQPKGICPPGWHIPTDQDWSILINYLGGDSIAGGKLKQSGLNNWASPNTGATNSSGFTAFGAGNHTAIGFDLIMRHSSFWSSTRDNATAGYAWSRNLFYSSQDVNKASGKMENSFSIRCLKD